MKENNNANPTKGDFEGLTEERKKARKGKMYVYANASII